MVPHGGVPAVVMHVSERHRRGSERGYAENSKSFFENEFHGNPGRNKGVSTRSAMQCLPSATAMRRYINAVTDGETPDELWEHVGTPFANDNNGLPNLPDHAMLGRFIHFVSATAAGRILQAGFFQADAAFPEVVDDFSPSHRCVDA
jgi:hypothetical protein